MGHVVRGKNYINFHFPGNSSSAARSNYTQTYTTTNYVIWAGFENESIFLLRNAKQGRPKNGLF